MCQTYKDMIQDLRDKAEFISLSLGNLANDYKVELKQAANAIERLCIENDCLSEDVTDLVRELNKQKWIPVTERLPEQNDPVLVVTKYMSIGIDRLEGMVFDKPDFRKLGVDSVTHWMPLPEPPKEET